LSGAGFRPDARAVPAGEIKFVSISLSESSVDAVDKEVMFTFKNGAMRKFTGAIAAADVQRAAVLLSRHH
jgi:hypothetical protein